MTVKSEWMWIVVIVVAAVLPFSNTVSGDFVYDDRRQIVLNPLIQNTELMGKALTSDVWAFKGDGSVWSNYWRPVFTAWCIINFGLFGLDPFGWHLLNILLHAGVCVVAYILLRRWDLGPLVAAAIVLVFATHPIHSESVAWISGSPDILFGLFLLLSLLFADRAADPTLRLKRTRNLVAALIFYSLALGSKEIALICAPIFVLIFRRSGETGPRDWLDSVVWRGSAPFIALAIVYFFVRWAVLGAVSRPAENATDLMSAVLTAPAVFVFYLRQILFPLWLGPNYPLRPVSSIGLLSVIVPALVSLFGFAALFFVARRSFVRTMGLAIFVLALLPAFFITAFPDEQIVHDRYLYLALLGFLIVIISLVFEYATRDRRGNVEKYVFAGFALVALLLGVRTFAQNVIWKTDVELWRHAVLIDERSAFNWLQLGARLTEKGENGEALAAYNRSLELRHDPLALMGRGRVLIAKGDLNGATRDLENAVGVPLDKVNAYTLFQSYEALAVALQQGKNYAEAERRLRDARRILPIYHGALTEKLAVILYLQDRKTEALAELESARVNARNEMMPASKAVFLRLGRLYAELGRKQDSKVALEEYLSATKNVIDKAGIDERRQAQDLLRQVSGR